MSTLQNEERFLTALENMVYEFGRIADAIEALHPLQGETFVDIVHALTKIADAIEDHE